MIDLDKKGFQLFIHAIGDRGIHTAIDALEAAWKVNGKPAAPHQIVHVELIKDEDVKRFSQYDITASIQPRHLAPDISSQWALSIGEHRHQFAWPLNKLKKAGARFAFSSDWNVAEMDPLIGIYTAVTRQNLKGYPEEGWQPQERLDLTSAIVGYTLDGAISNGIAGERGSLAIGKYADMVVLSDNLFDIKALAIKDVKVLKTIFEGERRNNDSRPPLLWQQRFMGRRLRILLLRGPCFRRSSSTASAISGHRDRGYDDRLFGSGGNVVRGLHALLDQPLRPAGYGVGQRPEARRPIGG